MISSGEKQTVIAIQSTREYASSTRISDYVATSREIIRTLTRADIVRRETMALILAVFSTKRDYITLTLSRLQDECCLYIREVIFSQLDDSNI